MAIYVDGIPYENVSGYSVHFPDDWQGEQTEARLADKIEGSRIRSLSILQLPKCIRKLYIPAGIDKLWLDKDLGEGLEEIEVDPSNKSFRSDGHALYSTDGKALIRLIDNRIETYAVDEATEEIDGDAFSFKPNLRRIILASNVKFLYGTSFRYEGFAAGSSGLQSVEISRDNPHLKSDGKAIYTGDGKLLLCVACDGLGSYTVADGTELMTSYAFNGREGLHHVRLPETLRGVLADSLNGDAFALMFESWKDDLQFEIAQGNPYLCFEDNAFYSADRKRLLQVVKDVQQYAVHPETEVIERDAFNAAPSLRKVLLPEGLKAIKKGAFAKCKELIALGCSPEMEENRYVFPNSLEEIGEDAFSRKHSSARVDDILIGENIREIGQNAFEAYRLRTFTALCCVEIGTTVFARMGYSVNVDMLLLPAMNPSKIKKSLQELAVSSYCKAALDNNPCCEVGAKAYQAYLKRNRKRYEENVIENVEVIRYMLKNGLVEDTEIDAMVDQVNGEQDIAWKAELMNYSKRFSFDGIDRMMKKMDQEAEEEEKKLKAVQKKEDYASLPLSVRAAAKHKLNPQAKVELLEEAVLHGTLEDIQNVCKVHGPFEFTARALAMAARCRTLDFTEELLKNGASFVYEATPAFTRKYNCIVKVTNHYSYAINYALLLLEKPDRALRIEKMEGIPVSSVEERCHALMLICKAGTSESPLTDLLYQAILNHETEIVDALKTGGINQLDFYTAPMAYSDNFVSMDAASICERNAFLWSLPWDDQDKLYWVLSELLEAGGGRTIHFSGSELADWNDRIRVLCCEKVFELVMAGKVDLSKAKPTSLIKGCMQAGNLRGLQYALDQGRAADKNTLSRTAKRLDIQDASVLAWLQES